MSEVLIFGNGWLGGKFSRYLGTEISGVDITDVHDVCAYPTR